MTRCSLFMAGLAAFTAAGCMPKMTLDQMKEMKVERPAELDALQAFVGEWRSTGTCKMLMVEGEPELTTTGTSKAEWAADGWYVVEKYSHEMQDLGPMHGVGVWTYDASDKEYEVWWFESDGSTGDGEMTHDAATKTWKMKGEFEMGGHVMYGEGSVKIVDDSTMEWHWKAWADALHTMPAMEMKGTSTKTSG